MDSRHSDQKDEEMNLLIDDEPSVSCSLPSQTEDVNVGGERAVSFESDERENEQNSNSVQEPLEEVELHPGNPQNTEEEVEYTVETLNSAGGNGVTRILQNQRNNPIWRRTIYLEFFWLFVTTILLAFALLSYRYNVNLREEEGEDKLHPHHPPNPRRNNDLTKECNGQDTRIVNWALVHTVLQVMMLLLNGMFQWMLPRTDTEVISERRLKNIMSLYVLGRFSHLLWLVWALLGIIWTFEARICKSQLGVLYMVCFSISVVHLVAFCIPLIICCCSLPVGFLVWCFCPTYMNRHNRSQQTQKASKRQIKKHTMSMKFKPFDESSGSMSSFSIKKEDANCAICLGDYEEDEELRFLQCKHHFHAECIMEWLQQNKTCPMCKKPIDGEEPQPEPTRPQQQERNSDISAIDVSDAVPFIV